MSFNARRAVAHAAQSQLGLSRTRREQTRALGKPCLVGRPGPHRQPSACSDENNLQPVSTAREAGLVAQSRPQQGRAQPDPRGLMKTPPPTVSPTPCGEVSLGLPGSEGDWRLGDQVGEPGDRRLSLASRAPCRPLAHSVQRGVLPVFLKSGETSARGLQSRGEAPLDVLPTLQRTGQRDRVGVLQIAPHGEPPSQAGHVDV